MFQIREAKPDDTESICQVLLRSVREICAGDYNNDPEVLEQWCSNKTPEIIENWLGDSQNYMLVAENESNEVVGVALYRRDQHAVNLCYLIPEALHQGIGSRLLRALEEEARRLGHKQITLTSSITARNFYNKHGYQSSGPAQYRGKILGYPMYKDLLSGN